CSASRWLRGRSLPRAGRLFDRIGGQPYPRSVSAPSHVGGTERSSLVTPFKWRSRGSLGCEANLAKVCRNLPQRKARLKRRSYDSRELMFNWNDEIEKLAATRRLFTNISGFTVNAPVTGLQ